MTDDKRTGIFNIVKYLVFGIPKTAFAAIYIVFACALFKEFFSPTAHFIICLGTAIFCGYEILDGAVLAVKNKRYLHSDVYLSAAIIGTFVIGMYYEAVFAAAVFSICRSVVITFDFWMKHEYEVKGPGCDIFYGAKSETEQKISNTVTAYSVISLFVIIAMTVIVPLVWRVPIVSWLRRAFILIAAACPGAVTLSAYVEYYKCVNTACKNKIYFESKNTFEKASKVTSVVFGKIDLVSEHSYIIDYVESQGISAEELLLLAAYTCSFSEEELSAAVVKGSRVNVDISLVDMYKSIPGFGAAVILNGVKVLAGSAELMYKSGIEIGEGDVKAAEIFVAVQNRYAGKIVLKKADESSAVGAVAKLNENDIDRILLLTSAPEKTAASIAKRLGISEVWSDMSLAERKAKLESLREMQLEGECIAFVADCAEDVELTASADLGIVVGAANKADIVVYDGDYIKVADAFKLSRRLTANIRYNLTLAWLLKAVTILFAVFGFAGIWCVAVIDAVVTALVIKGRKSAAYE